MNHRTGLRSKIRKKSEFFESRKVTAKGNIIDVKTHRLYATMESMDKTNIKLMSDCYISTIILNLVEK